MHFILKKNKSSNFSTFRNKVLLKNLPKLLTSKWERGFFGVFGIVREKCSKTEFLDFAKSRIFANFSIDEIFFNILTCSKNSTRSEPGADLGG